MGKVGENQGEISKGLITHLFCGRSGETIRVRLMEEIGKASQSEKHPNDRYLNDPVFHSAIETLVRNEGEPSIELVAQLLDVIERQKKALSDLSDVLMRSNKEGIGILKEGH